MPKTSSMLLPWGHCVGGLEDGIGTRQRSGPFNPSDVYLNLGATSNRPALGRSRPIHVTPVQGTWTTSLALTGPEQVVARPF